MIDPLSPTMIHLDFSGSRLMKQTGIWLGTTNPEGDITSWHYKMCSYFHLLEGQFGELQFGLFYNSSHCTEQETNVRVSAKCVYYNYTFGNQEYNPCNNPSLCYMYLDPDCSERKFKFGKKITRRTRRNRLKRQKVPTT